MNQSYIPDTTIHGTAIFADQLGVVSGVHVDIYIYIYTSPMECLGIVIYYIDLDLSDLDYRLTTPNMVLSSQNTGQMGCRCIFNCVYIYIYILYIHTHYFNLTHMNLSQELVRTLQQLGVANWRNTPAGPANRPAWQQDTNSGKHGAGHHKP